MQVPITNLPRPFNELAQEAVKAYFEIGLTPLQMLEKLKASGKAKDEINNVYTERNICVASLARCAFALGCEVSNTKTDIPGWDAAWHNCVYIELPTGQVSWHYHDSDAALFDWIPQKEIKWDGHDTPEKYRRLTEWYPMPDAESIDFKVEMDGDKFICKGSGFINLQESSDYAFGDTKDWAVKNYYRMRAEILAAGQEK